MLYNFENSLPLNYNLQEIKQTAKNASDVIMLSYLHFSFEDNHIMTYRNFIKEHRMTQYPALKYSGFVFYNRYTKKYTSTYQIENLTTKLNYKKILKEAVDEEDRVRYLELVSLLTPYSKSKFLPKEYVGRVPNTLVIRRLVKFVDGGIILPKERC